MQEQVRKLRAEATERKRVAFLVVGSIALTYTVAPWVWPIGLGAGLVAVAVVRFAGRGALGAAGIALAVGLVGGFFTLPASSLHSFWVREHWAHPQNAPVLSLYAVALFVWGVALLFLCQKQRNFAARQTE